jgi:hypothetical protein
LREIIEPPLLKNLQGNEMAAGHGPAIERAFRLVFILGILSLLAGCKKEDLGADSKSTIVSLTGQDVREDGGITDAGMKKIEAQASAASLTVALVRAPISDVALDQFAKFPNLRFVQAIGSPLTQPAIDKLKASVPEVQVTK